MDKLTSEQRQKNMRAVKSKGSKIELAVMKSLWAKGYRYRKNNKTVYGTPDITFKSLKIAIFLDSEFWHGYNWLSAKENIKSNHAFWHKKIEANIERDKIVNEKLVQSGWIVLRFWGKEIEKKLDECIDKIVQVINERKELHK